MHRIDADGFRDRHEQRRQHELLFRLSGLDDEPKQRARFPDGVAACLRRLYYDVAQSAAPLSFRALLEIADPSRILFGTDYPFARNAEKVMKDTIGALARFDGFDAALRRKIALDNARAPFPRAEQSRGTQS